MQIDGAVAANVKRLREERKWSTADLAGRLGVGRHITRDYERPRKGAPQRQFLWEEIVNLCAVFNVTIFQLVLPPEGHRTLPPGLEHLPLMVPQVIEARGSDFIKAQWRRDDRGMLLDVLIYPGFEPEHIDTLISMKARREEWLIEELKTLLSEKEKDQ